MTSQGPIETGIGENRVGIGTLTWADPSNIVDGYDPSYWAQISSNPTGVFLSKWLAAYQFGFTIPSTAIITGIEVNVKRSANVNDDSTYAYDNSAKIIQGTVIQGNNNKKITKYSTSIETITYGGPTDLWGITWTPAQINSPSGFGFALSTGLACTFYNAAQIYQVTISVYYQNLDVGIFVQTL